MNTAKFARSDGGGGLQAKIDLPPRKKASISNNTREETVAVSINIIARSLAQPQETKMKHA